MRLNNERGMVDGAAMLFFGVLVVALVCVAIAVPGLRAAIERYEARQAASQAATAQANADRERAQAQQLAERAEIEAAKAAQIQAQGDAEIKRATAYMIERNADIVYEVATQPPAPPAPVLTVRRALWWSAVIVLSVVEAGALVWLAVEVVRVLRQRRGRMLTGAPQGALDARGWTVQPAALVELERAELARRG